MTASPDLAAWRETMATALPAIAEQGNGILELYVVRPADALQLHIAAAAGDVSAARLMRAVEQTVIGIEAAPRSRPALCAACPRPVRKNYTPVIAMPAADSPAQALGMGICSRCGQTDAEIWSAGAKALRRLWPASRPFSVTHADAGHA